MGQSFAIAELLIMLIKKQKKQIQFNQTSLSELT